MLFVQLCFVEFVIVRGVSAIASWYLTNYDPKAKERAI
jgi:hypothetical protein